ncbi:MULTISPECIES: hypothetical protein [Parafrankia]|nr:MULTISPECIES: hypothetical protein [Parafrankia]MBE3206720.1 hypothetical protein [Parafrankia sp. CH37]
MDLPRPRRRVLSLPGAPRLPRPEQRLEFLARSRRQLQAQQRYLAADPGSAAQVGERIDDIAVEIRDETEAALAGGVSIDVIQRAMTRGEQRLRRR